MSSEPQLIPFNFEIALQNLVKSRKESWKFVEIRLNIEEISKKMASKLSEPPQKAEKMANKGPKIITNQILIKQN